MLHTRLAGVTILTAFAILVAPPSIAQAQIGGLVSRAREAAQPNQVQKSRNTTVPITSANLDAYVLGYRAEKAEERRLDSAETLANSTPESARQIDIMRCQSAAMARYTETPAQMRSDSALAMRQFAGMDTTRMKQLAKAAQAGDAAAMAQLQAMSMQMAQRQATDPAMIARSQQLGQQMKAQAAQTQACQKSAPPASSYVAKINSARSDMKKYGSRSSEAYTAHLDSVKLSAAGGMSATQYAALQERISGFLASDKDPAQGYTQAELQTLHAHRAALQALTN